MAVLTVLLLNPADRHYLEEAESGAFGPIEVVVAPDPPSQEQVRALVSGADVVFGDSRHLYKLDRELLTLMAGRCRAIVQPSVGYDEIDSRAATDLGIPIANAPGFNSDAVADWVIMAMLTLLRHGTKYDQQMHAGGWTHISLGHELGTRTVGVVGLGNIGRTVVRRLVGGFGCSVLTTDVWEQAPPWFGDLGERARYVELNELLEAVDILTLHIPLTEQTEHMINAKSLSTMREGALIVNAARGRLIEQEALLDALSTGKLAGAALDVYDEEPLRPTSALRSTTRLVLTPHIAWATEEAMGHLREMTTTSIRRVLLGDPPLNIGNGVPWRVPQGEGVVSPVAPSTLA